MPKRTAAVALVEALMANGVEYGFGVPGESYLAVLDALHDVSDSFTFINARNEGGGAFMAEAYGKLTGKPGVLFVTRGPGITNASIGIHTAMQDSSPMVVFVGQIASHMRGREAFQEIDYKAVFGTMAKWVVEIDHADRVPELVSRAFKTAVSGRPGPVVVALPEDMLIAKTDAVARPAATPVKPHITKADIDAVGAMLTEAKAPVLVAGGGGWNDNGKAALKRFAEVHKLPVVVGFRNQDLLDNHHPSYAGDAGVGMPPRIRTLLGGSDLILAVGVRFGEMLSDAYTLFDPATFCQKLIHVHASEDELGKIFTPDLAVMSCPNAAMNGLLALEGDAEPVWSQRTIEAHAAWKQSIEAPAQGGHGVDMAAIMAHLREVLPDNVIVTNGAGNFAIWPSRHLPFGENMRLLGPQAGAMGAGVPAAVMAKIVEPHRMALCFAGDGDFQMNGQELACCMERGQGPIVLVLNNGQYGTIRMHQERDYPARVSGTQIVNPDFAKLAEAYGMMGLRVEKTEDFADAFARAMDSTQGAVLDIVIDPNGLTPTATVQSLRKAAK
ncbi:MAG: thiamine pyrophosphate-dependent enzyme [Pseudomonadota bacterium]